MDRGLRGRREGRREGGGAVRRAIGVDGGSSDLRAFPRLAYRDGETRLPLGHLGPPGTWILGVLGQLGHLGQIALLPTLLGMNVSPLLGIYLIEHAPI